MVKLSISKPLLTIKCSNLSDIGNDQNRWLLYSVWENGVQKMTGSSGTGSINTIGLQAGAGRMFNGEMAEIVIYSGEMGSTDRASVRSALASKWGL